MAPRGMGTGKDLAVFALVRMASTRSTLARAFSLRDGKAIPPPAAMPPSLSTKKSESSGSSSTAPPAAASSCFFAMYASSPRSILRCARLPLGLPILPRTRVR